MDIHCHSISNTHYKSGEFSETTYQLDATTTNESSHSMVEAKDYSLEGKKVGRGDIQKMQGALTDLSLTNGIFASASDYTSPAVKYAGSSVRNPIQKPIELFSIRPSISKDEEGRVKRINIRSTMRLPNYQNAAFEAKYRQEYAGQISNEEAIKLSGERELDGFYERNGNVKFTIKEFVRNISALILQSDIEEVYATWIFNDVYLKQDGKLYSLRGLTVKVPVLTSTTEIVIEADGNPKLYVKSLDGSIDKLIYDEELKKVRFENGKVEVKK